MLVIKSFIPDLDIETTLNWLPLDTQSAEEVANVNLTKAQTATILIESGIISSEEERQRIATDKTSGYNEMGLEGAIDIPDDFNDENDGDEPT
jgi:hypothetical protein